MMQVPLAIRRQIGKVNQQVLRSTWHKGVQFAEPDGDPGWFGPDSAMWYVHGHSWALFYGMLAASAIENLHPDLAWMGVEHSDIYKVVDGKRTNERDMERGMRRASRSFSFFTSTAFGPTKVAEAEARMVKAMHQTVKGLRPDGKPYDGMEPELLRWTHNTIAWGIGTAHGLYHPHPLQGSDLDRYVAEYAKVGEALGVTDAPTTMRDVLDQLEAALPVLAVTAPCLEFFDPFDPNRYPHALRPVVRQLEWAVLDILPDFARRLLRAGPRSNAVVTRARRATSWAVINGLEYGGGHMPELEQSRRRAVAPALASV